MSDHVNWEVSRAGLGLKLRVPKYCNGSHYAVWLQQCDGSESEVVIGVGKTRGEAIRRAVVALERAIERLQEPEL